MREATRPNAQCRMGAWAPKPPAVARNSPRCGCSRRARTSVRGAGRPRRAWRARRPRTRPRRCRRARPSGATVEPDAEPASVADVRRHEEPLRIRLHEHLLHPVGSSAPDRKASVAMVICQHHQERALRPHEEGRRSVAESLARLGKREADLAKLRQHVRLLPLGGTAHALMVAEVDDQPRGEVAVVTRKSTLSESPIAQVEHRLEVAGADELLDDRRSGGSILRSASGPCRPSRPRRCSGRSPTRAPCARRRTRCPRQTPVCRTRPP